MQVEREADAGDLSFHGRSKRNRAAGQREFQLRWTAESSGLRRFEIQSRAARQFLIRDGGRERGPDPSFGCAVQSERVREVRTENCGPVKVSGLAGVDRESVRFVKYAVVIVAFDENHLWIRHLECRHRAHQQGNREVDVPALGDGHFRIRHGARNVKPVQCGRQCE